MQCAGLEMTFCHSTKSNNMKTCLFRSRYYVSIKFDFPPITYNHWFYLSKIVFHFIKKVLDASGFPLIRSSLRFTQCESKQVKNHLVNVWTPLV